MRILDAIPFAKLPQIPPLVIDFIDGKIPEFSSELFSVCNIENKIQQKKISFSKKNRELLVSALDIQMKTNSCTEQQKENLEKLKYDNTFTITTGHQLNLFSGATFFIYKILQTIKTASYLNDNLKNNHFVPVFWMATEDHDFEEIRYFNTQNKKYTIDAEYGTAVGRLVPDSLKFKQDFENEIKYLPFGKELLDILKKSYTEGRNLAQATRELVNKLFGKYGIIVIDGDDAKLKSAMKNIFYREIKENILIKTTESQRKKIETKYKKVQVNPREINLFYLNHKRERIISQGQNFATLGGENFTDKEIEKEIENNPERFSPNALMRPVYQETILPNVSYIGGNAEIAYWLELKDFFKEIKLPFPVLIPRHSMLWLNKKQIQKIQKNKLTIQECTLPLEQIIKSKIKANHKLEQLLEEKEEIITKSFLDIEKKASATDITFSNLVIAEKQRMHNSFRRMKKRLLRAEKRKQNEKIERINSLYKEIYPNNSWQERQWNFSVFYAEKGDLWLDTCYKMINPQQEPSLIISEI